MDIIDNVLEEYNALHSQYEQLETIATEVIEQTVGNERNGVMQISHRLKTRESVRGKLHKKPEKYSTLENMTDLLGYRIVCYFADQVDEIAARLADTLDVDWERSTDKRAAIAPDAFGYLSLHYICTLPKDKVYPEALVQLPFEIQIRSSLQHTWAEIEHDLGYKTKYGIPRDVRREFSRIAGLLELADEAFVHIRSRISEYQKELYEQITNDHAESYHLDLVSLTMYIQHSRQMTEFMNEIRQITGAAIIDTDPENALEKLDYLGIRTLGDLSELVETERDHALQLIRDLLGGGDIEELISTVGIYYLCRSRLIYGNYDSNAIAGYLRLSDSNEENVRKQTDYLLKKRAHS
ncbi:MAG: hypothetical protein J6M27_05830 [Lachnospiraceae bacterium]|nr:hypothetical protein [Lachnospiraceae bacterium]